MPNIFHFVFLIPPDSPLIPSLECRCESGCVIFAFKYAYKLQSLKNTHKYAYSPLKTPINTLTSYSPLKHP